MSLLETENSHLVNSNNYSFIFIISYNLIIAFLNFSTKKKVIENNTCKIQLYGTHIRIVKTSNIYSII